MNIQGCDCSIVIKTTHREMDVPYSEETLREAVSLLMEEAGIEGDGVCRAIRKNCGFSGCVVTPLTIETAPLLLYLAFGSAGLPVYVSETRNIYKYGLNLVPKEDTGRFDLIQDRGGQRRLFVGCEVKGFELRFDHEDAIKLKLDISGEFPPEFYPYADITQYQASGGEPRPFRVSAEDTKMPDTAIGRERFNSEFVTYKINNQEVKNIYGVTLTTKKESGTKTEIWIKRILDDETDLPEIIDELSITGRLLRDKYEYRYFGMFRITLKRLVLVSDETNVNSSDAVIGPLRYYVARTVTAETFSSSEEAI